MNFLTNNYADSMCLVQATKYVHTGTFYKSDEDSFWSYLSIVIGRSLIFQKDYPQKHSFTQQVSISYLRASMKNQTLRANGPKKKKESNTVLCCQDTKVKKKLLCNRLSELKMTK